MTSSNLPCNICDSSNSKLCAKCRSSAYCSIECQRADLSSHKLLCSQIPSSSRPGPSYKRAILFQTDLEAPQLVWIECQEKDNFDGGKFEYPEVGKHLGGKCSMPEVMSVRHNNRRNRPMENSLQLMFRAGSATDGLRRNKSIGRAVGMPTRQQWNGPVLVLRNRGNKLDPSHYDDITLHDFR